MEFSIMYPGQMTEPKGFVIPKLEDIQQAVKLAKMVLGYVDIPDLEEDFEFTVAIADKVQIPETAVPGVLYVSSTRSCESVILHPMPCWTVEDIFDSILYCLFKG